MKFKVKDPNSILGLFQILYESSVKISTKNFQAKFEIKKSNKNSNRDESLPHYVGQNSKIAPDC